MRETAVDLAKKDQHGIAKSILYYYLGLAKSMSEYEMIGTIALKYSYPDIAINAAETVYSMCNTPGELYIARENLAKAYQCANMPEKALLYNHINLEIDPDNFESNVSLAVSLKLNNQRSESEEVIERLKRLDITPEQRKGLYVTETHKMLREGRTADGIKCFLHSDKDRTTVFDIKGMKRWNGVVTPGSKIYVNDCGGYGDQLVNIRFFDTLRKYGMDPILFSNLERDDMSAVLRRNGYEVITDEHLIDKNVPWDYLMDLPISLNLTEEDLWPGPYITPKRSRKNYLGERKKFRVGIKCNGNPYFAQDTYRSIPFEQMKNVIPEDVEIYYFDIDQEKDGVINLKSKIKSWDDTLDFIDQMDVILSSCTSIVHASGSMGVPTIVCVPISEYYIWTSTRKDESSPWYGENFYVLKQQKPRCWDAPLKRANSIINNLIKHDEVTT